jgi:hypothetical protein
MSSRKERREQRAAIAANQAILPEDQVEKPITIEAVEVHRNESESVFEEMDSDTATLKNRWQDAIDRLNSSFDFSDTPAWTKDIGRHFAKAAQVSLIAIGAATLGFASWAAYEDYAIVVAKKAALSGIVIPEEFTFVATSNALDTEGMHCSAKPFSGFEFVANIFEGQLDPNAPMPNAKVSLYCSK